MVSEAALFRPTFQSWQARDTAEKAESKGSRLALQVKRLRAAPLPRAECGSTARCWHLPATRDSCHEAMSCMPLSVASWQVFVWKGECEGRGGG